MPKNNDDENKIIISSLNHKKQINDYFVEDSDLNDTFGVDDYDQEAKEFGFLKNNGTDVRNDRRSLRALINEILNVEKNVHTTMQIIRSRLGEPIGSNFENSGSSKKNLTYKEEKSYFDTKVWAADQLKWILNQIEKGQEIGKDLKIQKVENEIKLALHDLLNAENLIPREKSANLHSSDFKNHVVRKSKTSNTKASKSSKHPKKQNKGNFLKLILKNYKFMK